MEPQFPASEFDEWAASYDQSVISSRGFPFDGYQQVLETIVQQAVISSPVTVLDLGAGTGNLSELFAQKCCEVWGLDFSVEMLAIARAKLPDITFARADIRSGWPPEFQRRFDRIISAYTFHHFPFDEKVDLIKRLITDQLSPGGLVLIGDIAFDNAQEEDTLRQKMGEEWEQEYFWLADDSLAALRAAGMEASYTRISFCAGVFQIAGR